MFSATNCASVSIALTSTILIFTSFPINFVTSAFNDSAPAPPFPIMIPGLAVNTLTFMNLAVLRGNYFFDKRGILHKGRAFAVFVYFRHGATHIYIYCHRGGAAKRAA